MTFPTVDAVRKHAKVNMNDASVGMKDWRRAQTAQVMTVAVQVLTAIQQIHTRHWQQRGRRRWTWPMKRCARRRQAGTSSAPRVMRSQSMGDAYEAMVSEWADWQQKAISDTAALNGELYEAPARVDTAAADRDQANHEVTAVHIALNQAREEVAELRGRTAQQQEFRPCSRRCKGKRREITSGNGDSKEPGSCMNRGAAEDERRPPVGAAVRWWGRIAPHIPSRERGATSPRPPSGSEGSGKRENTNSVQSFLASVEGWLPFS